MASSFCELKTGRELFVERRPNEQELKYEVHFPQNFVQYHPWGWGEVPCQFPVSVLCHATHNREAEQIRANAPVFRFQVNQKRGKTYNDHNNFGESHRFIPDKPLDWEISPQPEHTPFPDSHYRSISDDEQIFPGYYSWWGLAVDQQLSPPWIESKYLPPYLKRPPESVYGGNVFRSSLHNLLGSYAASRQCRIQDIHLKMGGTLRYKREIAYVVIVCTSMDEVPNYVPITHAPLDVFNPRGLVDRFGRVTNMACVPLFTTRYMNSWVSYETLNFAFYFNGPGEFICNDVIEDNITHDNFCIRPTRPVAVFFEENIRRFRIKRVCADHTPTRDQQRHDRVTSFAWRHHGVEWDEQNPELFLEE